MNYKTIAVYLNDTAENFRCTEFAIRVALTHKAHLRGIYALYESPSVYFADLSAYEMLETLRQKMEEAREQSKRTFSQAARKACVLFDWHALDGDVKTFISFYACTADLSVVMQKKPGAPGGYLPSGFEELVLLNSGRPTLFLPYAGVLPLTFENVAVAWNGSRESARALADAYPFLKQAKKVVVLIAKTRSHSNWDDSLLDNVVKFYLSRHGVDMDVVHAYVDEGEVADWLLSAAAGADANLMVSGAYGHSRISEIVWGGVTDALLRDMNIPLLMSH